MHTRKIFPIFAIVLGLYWVIAAFDYGLWVRRGPGGGFFPLIGGLLTVIFSALYLKNEIRKPTPATVDIKFTYPIAALLGVLLCSYVFGMIPCMFLFMLLWLWRYEKFALSLSLYVSVGTIAGLYMIFVYWLAVPLPLGVVGEAIFG